jgi:hypothetical protein
MFNEAILKTLPNQKIITNQKLKNINFGARFCAFLN